MCLKIKVLASLQVILDFFLYFSKEMGRSGDGKRNILWEWPYKKEQNDKERRSKIFSAANVTSKMSFGDFKGLLTGNILRKWNITLGFERKDCRRLYTPFLPFREDQFYLNLGEPKCAG